MLTGNVKHLIERKMDEILTAFQRDDDRIFGHRCNFQYSIVEIEGEENQLSLDELLKKAEALTAVQRRKTALAMAIITAGAFRRTAGGGTG